MTDSRGRSPGPDADAAGGAGAGDGDGRAADRGPDIEQAERRGRDVATREGDVAAPSFRDEPYPRSYGRPGRSFLRRALRAYVMGHDRGWEAERKLEAADREVEPRFADRFREVPPEGASAAARGKGRGRGAAGAGDADLDEATPARPDAADEDRPRARIPSTRFGVPVPERLDFHRGPDTWRDRIRRREDAAPADRVFREEAKQPEE